MTVMKFVDGELLPYDEHDLRLRQQDLDEFKTNQAQVARAKRDSMLSASDWSQAVDTPQLIKDKWAPYRQALRDVPQQAGFPYSVQWPVKPE